MLINGALAIAIRNANQATDYLLNDTFSTDRATGAIDGTSAEPGPGQRVAIEVDGQLSIAGGKLLATAQATPLDGDLGLYYTTLFARVMGRLLKAGINLPTLGAANPTKVGWGGSGVGPLQMSAASGRTALGFAANGFLRANMGSAPEIVIGAFSAATDYEIALILSATGGGFIFIKGGAFTVWTMLYHTATGTLANRVAVNNSGNTAQYDYLRVPVAVWLPTPLISDGFSASTSDGLGHAEGVAGGIGNGGAGVAWTNRVGTWSVSGGAAAATALSGGVAVRTANCGKADALVTSALTRTAGTAGIVARYVDASNHVQARHTGTNAQLVKVVAGVNTTLVDAVVTYVAGAEIRIICQGQQFRLFYNNAAVGTEQTIADAALASATLVGLRSTDTANTFDNFATYARGSGGEYAALDGF